MRRIKYYPLLMTLCAFMFCGCVREEVPSNTNNTNAVNETIATIEETLVVETTAENNTMPTHSETVAVEEQTTNNEKQQEETYPEEEIYPEEEPITETTVSENIVEEAPAVSDDDLGWA